MRNMKGISNNKAVIWALNKERLINSGFYDLATAYQSVHVNYWNRRVPNGTHGGVRGRRLVTASYLIPPTCRDVRAGYNRNCTTDTMQDYDSQAVR